MTGRDIDVRGGMPMGQLTVHRTAGNRGTHQRCYRSSRKKATWHP